METEFFQADLIPEEEIISLLLSVVVLLRLRKRSQLIPLKTVALQLLDVASVAVGRLREGGGSWWRLDGGG